MSSRRSARAESSRALENTGLRSALSLLADDIERDQAAFGTLWGDVSPLQSSQQGSLAAATQPVRAPSLSQQQQQQQARRSPRLSLEFDAFQHHALSPGPTFSQLIASDVAAGVAVSNLPPPDLPFDDNDDNNDDEEEPTLEFAAVALPEVAPVVVKAEPVGEEEEEEAPAKSSKKSAAKRKKAPAKTPPTKRRTGRAAKKNNTDGDDDDDDEFVAVPTPADDAEEEELAAAAAAAAAAGEDESDASFDERKRKRAAAARSKRGGASSPKAASSSKGAASPSASPRRGRRTRLETDEDPNRERVPHSLSFGTLTAPPKLTNEAAQRTLEKIQRSVQARDDTCGKLAAKLPAEDVLAALAKSVADELRELQRVCCATLLSAAQLALFLRLRQQLENQAIKAATLSEALESKDGRAAALLYVEQPRPSIPFKSKLGHVGAFTLAQFCVPPKLAGKYAVVGAATCKSKDWSFKEAMRGVSLMSDERGVVTFLEIAAEESSRMEFVTLHFTAKLPRLDVVSEPSQPMIVVTNESQWPGAAKKLLWLDTFVDEEEIPWPLFANHLIAHTVVALYGRFDMMKRSLQEWELLFVHRNARWFNGAAIAKRDAALEFWNFYGAVLTTLRFKRHIATMWETGQLIGLISKEQAVAMLAQHETGTFCLRFSESVPGAFAVAYVTNDAVDPIKHFLVKPSDLGHNRTLPDFLRDKAEFRLMLTLVDASDASKTAVAPKDAVLRTYYKTGRKNMAALERADGYVNV